MKRIHLLLLMLLAVSACRKDKPAAESSDTLYFPPVTGTAWATTSPATLGWHTNAIAGLKDFLAQKNTKSFIILVNGKIVMEEYFNGHTAAASWEWNSAGKTLVATTVGIAQQEGLLHINTKAADYLGSGWTSMPDNKESLITVKHLLSMTSGNDDTKQWVIKPNLTYVADAGTRWAYSNIFQKLTDIVTDATGKPFETYFSEKIKSKTGMDGFWNFGTIYTIYHSTTRSMARFGLLALNKGKWNNEVVINENFFNESTTSSQNINPSYGYLWWLNGKPRYMIPGMQTVFTGSLIPNAPADMYAAMGASDQRMYVVPGKKMVVVRMGEASDPANPSFAVSGFDSLLWAKINAVIN